MTVPPPPNPLHPLFRGFLESRAPTSVFFEDKTVAAEQVDVLTKLIESGGITDAGCGMSARSEGYDVHYWRGAWSPWPAPAIEDRKVGP